MANPSASSDVWLSTEDADATLSFGGFGSDVRAVGGRIFATERDGSVSGTRVFRFAQDIMGNTVEPTLTPLTAEAFFGVSFNHALASLRLVTENDPQSLDAYFATVNDLVLAEARAPAPAPVPEPSTLLLVAAPLLLLAGRRPRRND